MVWFRPANNVSDGSFIFLIVLHLNCMKLKIDIQNNVCIIGFFSACYMSCNFILNFTINYSQNKTVRCEVSDGSVLLGCEM
jgi:hypothetical protein